MELIGGINQVVKPERITVNGVIITELATLEREEIIKALSVYNGNKVKAAEALGIHRAVFYRRLEKYSLSHLAISR